MRGANAAGNRPGGDAVCVCVFVREKEIEKNKGRKRKREHSGPTSPLCGEKETRDKEGLRGGG